MSAVCQSCFRQATDTATVCVSCTGSVFASLREVEDLMDELTLTLTRQDQIAEREGGKTTEIPLPWREHAAEAAWVLHAVLLAWVRVLSKAKGDHLRSLIQTSDRRRYSDTVELARWILRHEDTFRRHQDAAIAVEELVDAVRNARRAVDRPVVLVYRGRCDECAMDMYVPPQLPEVTCRGCGSTYDAAERRAWLVRKLESQLAPAAEIARGLSSLLGEQLPVDRIYQWKSRGRLFPRGVDRQGRPLYAVGDVVNLATGVAPEPDPLTAS